MIDKNTIDFISNKLVEVYNPLTIYLFGSYAWGEPNDDSDLDIMIIIKDSNDKPYKRMKPAYVALRGLCIPKDIIVYTEEEFERQVMEPSTLIYKVKNEGIKLYGAA